MKSEVSAMSERAARIRKLHETSSVILDLLADREMLLQRISELERTPETAGPTDASAR